MKRVCVIGCGGAGKSTFARNLSDKTNLPLIHLDCHYFNAGWEKKNDEEFNTILKDLVKEDEWIMDGNFHNFMDIRFPRTDTIFWLDYPTWRNLARVFKRIITTYGQQKPDMAEGCAESLDWEFIRYVYNFRKNSRPRVLKKLQKHAQNCQIIIFKHPKDAENWINQNPR